MLQTANIGTPTSVARDPVIVRGAVHAIIAAQYVYTFAFIYLPTDVRLAFAGVLLVVQTALAVVALTKRPDWASGLFLLAALMTLVCWGVSYGSGFGGMRVDIDPRIIAKDLQLFIASIWLLAFWDVLRIRFVAVMAMGSIVVGGILALTGPPSPFPGELWDTRFSTITGEVDEVPHDSAFFILLNAFIVDQLRRVGVVRRAVAWALMAFTVVLLIGYQARTAWVMFGAYYAAAAYFRWRHVDFVRSLPLVLLGLTAVGVAAYLMFSGADIERLGSGRVSSYMLRVEILSNRDLGPLMFGSGPGTDKIRTSVWWWEEKEAHNDYLSVIMTNGLLGVFAILVYLAALYPKLPILGKPLFFALIVGSGFSSAMLSRPTLSIYLFLAASVSIALSTRLEMAQLGSARG